MDSLAILNFNQRRPSDTATNPVDISGEPDTGHHRNSPKTPRAYFYAVASGVEGSKIYKSWAEASPNTRSPGCTHKKFLTLTEAEDFICHANK